MNRYTYRIIADAVFDTTQQSGGGMDYSGDLEAFNGLLVIEAVDEATADNIRMTFTNPSLWEKVED